MPVTNHPATKSQMTITVRFFASLRESMGRREIAVDGAQAENAADVWRLATGDGRSPTTCSWR